MTADPRERQILKDVEHLGLQRQGQLADLVEVDRALVRVFEVSGPTPVRTREGALLVPEQLGFEQAVRDGGAVHLDEGSIRPPRRRVNRPGDEVLADAALAAQQHGGVGDGDTLHHAPDRAHRGTAAQARREVGDISRRKRRRLGRGVAIGEALVPHRSAQCSRSIVLGTVHGLSTGYPDGYPPDCRCHGVPCTGPLWVIGTRIMAPARVLCHFEK